MAAEKQTFRDALGACRANLTAGHVATASAAVQRRVLDLKVYRAASELVLYSSKDNEIETDEIFAQALASGREIYFPKVNQVNGKLSLVRVKGAEQLRVGAFGILEPMGTETVPVAALRRALICVPGLAFSPGGQRLGRGGGFYDRLLSEAGPQLVSAGLAYSFQVLDELPQSPEDQRLNLIITESAIYGLDGCELSGLPSLAGQGGVPGC